MKGLKDGLSDRFQLNWHKTSRDFFHPDVVAFNIIIAALITMFVRHSIKSVHLMKIIPTVTHVLKGNQIKQAQSCAEGCEGGHLFLSLVGFLTYICKHMCKHEC